MRAPTLEETKRGALSRTHPLAGPARLTSLLAPRRDPKRRGQERDPRAAAAHLAAAAAARGLACDRKPDRPRAPGLGAEPRLPLPRGAPAPATHPRPPPTSATPGPARPAGLRRPLPQGGRPAVCTAPRLQMAWG